MKRQHSLALLFLAACTVPALAGPLTPPAGPVASTHKTLTEVEPRIAINATNTPGTGTGLYKITQPGSYYLLANLNGAAGRHGIEIAASGVTLDLRGFDLLGVPGSLDGISVVSTGLANITITNGSVRNWGGDGIDLSTALATNARISNIHASANGIFGILSSSGSTIANCSAAFNTAAGIHAGSGSSVTNCSAIGNGSQGINTLAGCSITNCSAYQNTSSGITVTTNCTVADSASYDNIGHGFSASSGCSISSCTASSNIVTGFVAGTGSTIANCTARSNGAGGMDVGSYCNLINSSASANTGNGIDTGTGCSLSNCSASSNTVLGINTGSSCTLANCAVYSNTGGGIVTSQGNTITNCSIFNNSGHGIDTQTGCTIIDCSVKFNTLDGIRVLAGCFVRGNNVTYAGWLTGDGAAIHATSQLNRIEGNYANRSDRGIQVDGQGNVIIKNTCAANTVNFVFAADNVYGPILNRLAPASPAVNTNSAASTLGSTDANANYAH